MGAKPKAGRSEKPKRQEDQKAQAERFIETARQHGADESGEEFERVFKKIVPEKRGVSAAPSRKKPDAP